jgi:hypothetical protein
MATDTKGFQMADSKKTALEVLEEMRKERDELNGMIQAFERRLGISSKSHVSASDDEGETPTPVLAVASMPIGFFHNLSQAAAAEKLLKMNPGQPYSTGQILEAFRNSGMDLNPRNSVQILYTALKRSPKFERVGNKAWGLREWYPEKKRKKEDREEEDSSSDS